MFSHTSRYYDLPKLSFRREDGSAVSYVSRRFLPPRDSLATMVQVRLAEGDRLDSIAAATLGSPELFWQVCDANDVLNPFELARQTGKAIRVPMPAPRMR